MPARWRSARYRLTVHDLDVEHFRTTRVASDLKQGVRFGVDTELVAVLPAISCAAALKWFRLVVPAHTEESIWRKRRSPDRSTTLALFARRVSCGINCHVYDGLRRANG